MLENTNQRGNKHNRTQDARKIKAKPFSLMPPKTKLVPSAAKPNSEAKSRKYFYQPQAAFGVQEKESERYFDNNQLENITNTNFCLS